MKNKISDQDVLRLLSSLKNAESNYPSDMMQPRRDMYIKQAAAMAVLANSGGNGGGGSESTRTTGSNVTSGGLSMGKVLETALVVALVVEAGVATYIYREKITDFFNSILSPKVEQIASPPSDSSSDILAVEETSTASPSVTVTVTSTMTETPTPPAPPLPAADDNNNSSNNSNESGGEEVQVTSTPNPSGNPGLHLGQTKQPTKVPKEDKNNTKSTRTPKGKNN